MNDFVEDIIRNCSTCENNVEYPPPHTCDICTSLNQEEDYEMWKPKQQINSTENKVKEALSLAWQYAQIDGGHHKMWVIDQMVRVLCGSEEEYNKWVERYETPVGIDDEYTWDVGIAP